MDVRTRVLPNGLTIASVRLAGFRTAAVGAFVRVGSRDEPAPLNGISHFLEHMAFKGTETRDARRISLEIERVGASMNAYTAKDHTAYHTVLLAEHMPVALDVLADVIRRSTFPAEEIERERQVILQELGDAADERRVERRAQRLDGGDTAGDRRRGQRRRQRRDRGRERDRDPRGIGDRDRAARGDERRGRAGARRLARAGRGDRERAEEESRADVHGEPPSPASGPRSA